MMDHQQPLVPPGAGFSPFAAGSPQGQTATCSMGMSAASSLNRHYSPSPAGRMGFASPDQTSAAASPSMIQPAIAAADLLGSTSQFSNGTFSAAGAAAPGSYNRTTAATLAAAGRQLSAGSALQSNQLQFYNQHNQQPQASPALGSPWRANSTDDALAAAVAAAGLAPPPPPLPYHSNAASPISRSSTATAQQLLFQQQQQLQQAALSRSLSVDVGVMSAQAAGGVYLGAGSRWNSGRLPFDSSNLTGHEQQRFGSVYDMKSLTAALAHVQAGTGDVRRMLSACTFRPRLPGLTKLVSQMSREGHWAKALEVYESLDAVGVRPDTTITNAAISACDKGGQWEKALQVFKSMSDLGMERDAITYSALISALSKGRQWSLAIDVFNHMVAEGVECDAVTCCSLITALDKGGQWQLAEQVFIQMYRHHPQFHVLLEGMDTESGEGPSQGNEGSGPQQAGGSSPNMGRATSLLAGTFTAAALSALSISEDALPPPEQLLATMEASGTDLHKSSSNNGRDQTDKLCSAGVAAVDAASGKSTGYPLATQSKPGVHGVNSGWKRTTGTGNTGNTHRLSTDCHMSSCSALGTPANTGVQGTLQATSSAVSSTSCNGSATGTADSTIMAEEVHSSQHGQQSSDGPARTLSGVWSKIMATAAVAEAQDSTGKSLTAEPSGSGAAADTSDMLDMCKRGSSDESLLSASDAVVHLMPAGKFRLIDAKDSSASMADTLQHTAEDPISTEGAAAHEPTGSAVAAAAAAAVPLLKPGTSAFAAAGSIPLEADPIGPSSTPDQQQPQHKGGMSPHRPPLHPIKHTGGTAAMQASVPGSQGSVGQVQQQGLSPAGSHGPGASVSPGSASPARTASGGTMMRLGLTRSLNSKKSSPNRVCCNALLAAYARATPPRWRQALKLLDVMWQCGGELVPDIVSYNTVMKACGNAQQTDKAFELYRHMQQRGIEASVATFGTLITIASEVQAYDLVKQSWGWLQASGLPVHITCVNSYLTALVKEDNWDAAVELFQQLKSNQLGVRPNSVTYNILMSACLTRDKPQNVKALFDEMTAANLSPTLISFNTLLHAYAKMGAWQDSLAVLQHMCTSSPVRPSTSSFNTVFCTLSNVAASVSDADKHVLAARVLDVYGMMAQLPGLHPDSALYRTIITTFSACAAPKMVLQVALIMAQQGHSMDASSASAALEALQQEAAWQLSGPLLYACFEAGAVVSPLLLQHILLVCTQDKAWRTAKEVLQVTCAANQLDAVAQLLQQTRTQLQAAVTGTSNPGQQLLQAPGLLGEPEALDELLFLTYLQAQYSSGSWAEGVGLFKQLQQNRGASFAVCNGVLLGSLLELMVVRGGAQGTIEAVAIVDSCHERGVMSHYIPLVSASNGASSCTAIAGSPLRSPAAPGHAAGASLLSPEQQLIMQLEATGSISASSGMGTFSLFPSISAAGEGTHANHGLELSLDFGHGATPDGYRSGAIGSNPLALTLLDVRGCSAVEALVLCLSWLGQLVELLAGGKAPSGTRLRVETGSVGPLDRHPQATDLKLYHPVNGSGVGQDASAVAPGAGKQEGVGSSTGSAGVAGAANESAATEAPAGSVEDSAAALAGTGDAALLHASSLQYSGLLQPPAVEPRAGFATPAQTDILQVPGSNLSVHEVVLALFSGQLSGMLGCVDVELLMAFSAAGRLPLGLLCLSPLPVHLPAKMHGGGVELDVAALSESIASAVAASHVEGSA